ncbi:hypothetical protein [Petrimonas sulfuriphila]|uniref:hypothetical protein n=1 Tax=Petrimonas sulfuriphila TaxID=285070 RepID=UPI003EBAA357
MTEPTPFNPGTEVVVYEGECRKYTNTSKFNEVIISKYGLSIPGTLPVRVGDLLTVTDFTGEFNGSVVEINAGNLGTTVFFNATGQ